MRGPLQRVVIRHTYVPKFDQPAVARPTFAPVPVSLYCLDCADIGMDVNLWCKPAGAGEGASVVGSKPHGTKCQAVASQAGFYKVKCAGATGWVKASIVRK